MFQHIVAFSGGADSTALALLMEDATPVFTDTKWEFPELYAHIAKFEQTTGREVVRVTHPRFPGGLPEYIRHAKFMPSHGARFCTRMFKIEAMNAWLESNDCLPVTLNIALRADEPADQRVGNLSAIDGLSIAYPLRTMGYTRNDVLRVCLNHDLLPRYPIYMARGGCTGCFYKRKSEVLAMIALQPAIMDELQVLEEGVQDERGRFFHMFPNVGCSISDLRNQPMLFEPEEVYAAALDKSDVGAVCGLFCNR